MTRLWLWDRLLQIKLKSILCTVNNGQPESYGFKFVSTLSSFCVNTQTPNYLDSTRCKLFGNECKDTNCSVTTSKNITLLTCAHWRQGLRLYHTWMRPTVIHDVGAGNHLLDNANEIIKRRGYKTKKTDAEDPSSSDDEAEDFDEDEDEVDFPPGYKERKAFVKSLRADAIVSVGLGLSRNSVDEIFLKSCLKVNGLKLLKKSKMLDEGDYVDMIVEKNEDKLKIKRVKLLRVLPERTQKDRTAVKLRVWKTAFEIDAEKLQW